LTWKIKISISNSCWKLCWHFNEFIVKQISTISLNMWNVLLFFYSSYLPAMSTAVGGCSNCNSSMQIPGANEY
jgi:hypothetical protein